MSNRNTHVHLGSEIQTSLDFKWLRRGWVTNGPDFEWDLKSKRPSILNPDKCQPFCKKHPDFERSGFRIVGAKAIAMAKAVPFENWTV